MTIPTPRRVVSAAIVIVIVIVIAAPPARAEDAASTDLDAWRLRTIVTVHRFLPDEPRADPDQPSLRYAFHGGRWKAMGGGGVVLVGVESDWLRLGLALDGLIELVNLDGGQPVPWESYRANVGFEALVESPRLSRLMLRRGGQLHLSLGWFHESDHAANLSGYRAQYLTPRSSLGAIGSSFNNGNFSSYEYVKIRATLRQPLLGDRLTAQATIGARLFPASINPGSLREMRAAALAETRLALRLSDGVRPFVSTYFELVDNDFVARAQGFGFGLDRTPLRYQIVNLGVDLVSAGGGIVSPYLSCSRSHGRGVDFPRFFGTELGVGITLLP